MSSTYRYRLIEDEHTGKQMLYIVDGVGGDDFFVTNPSVISSIAALFDTENEALIQTAINNVRTNRVQHTEDADVSDAVKRVRQLMDTGKISRTSEGYSINGESVPNSVLDLARNMENEDDVNALMNFVERLSHNPSENAKKYLFDWLRANPTMSITPAGFVLGYRGVRHDFRSNHSGFGYINGKSINAPHPNNVGNVISLPREMIDPNPNNDCSFGLHIGTYQYANGWASGCGAGSHVMAVVFDPADAVVVPPYDTHKIRVARFAVVGEVKKNQKSEDINSLFVRDYDIPEVMFIDNFTMMASFTEDEADDEDEMDY